MKKLIFLSLIISISTFIACGDGQSKNNNETTETSSSEVDVNKLNMNNLLAEIEKREKAFKGEKTVNHRNGILLMKAYAAFAERFSNREHAAEYLFKAGEIAMGAELPVESIRYLDKLYNDHPHFEKRAYGLFLKAFVLENQAQNLDEAKKTYELFLSEFPAHEMADDALASIANLGKTPEQIIREFEVRDSIAKANGAV
ncbi:MAG: hypothetical protein JKY48_18725 [Flavobacteriales bacterium]|nr:hypothetical protein [Flavobacteriales bacterium]